MTNLVQFPGLGLSFELDRVAFSIGGMNIYWYGVCIAVGMCLALVFAFRHSVEFGVDADAMVDVILIGVQWYPVCPALLCGPFALSVPQPERCAGHPGWRSCHLRRHHRSLSVRRSGL